MLRIGIMSGASIVPRFIEGAKESPYVSVDAIATRDINKSKSFAENYSITKYYGSYEELVYETEIDLIYIPLINSLHYFGAKLALEAGKHILLEKPFTLTYEEALELFSIAKANQLFLMEAQKEVFLPSIINAKRAILGGEIGVIQHIDIKDNRPGAEAIPWYWDIQKGGGLWMFNASYPLSLLQFILGAGFDSFYGLHIPNQEQEADKECLIGLKKSDLLISLFLTTRMNFRSTFTIIGSKGKLIIPNYWKTDYYMIEVDGKPPETRKFPMKSEFVFEINHVAKTIASGKIESQVMTEEITLENVRITENLFRQWNL